jgi:ATP-dependent RNA helicase DHX29
MAAGWGDDEQMGLSGFGSILNPHYDPEAYAEYPERTRRNLARLNEEVLDLELIEDVISWADEETPLPGAILVFLPGMGEISTLLSRLSASSRFGRGAKHWLLPLHSAISADQQRAAFKVSCMMLSSKMWGGGCD